MDQIIQIVERTAEADLAYFLADNNEENGRDGLSATNASAVTEEGKATKTNSSRKTNEPGSGNGTGDSGASNGKNAENGNNRSGGDTDTIAPQVAASSEQPQYKPPPRNPLAPIEIPTEAQTRDFPEQALTIYSASSSSSTTTEPPQPQTKGALQVATSSTSTTSEPTTTETSADSSGTEASDGLSSKTKLAIALPIAIVGLIVIAVLIFFFLRRRRRNAAPKYDMATGGQTSAISSSELMAIQKGEASVPANSSVHNLPPIQVSQQQAHAPDPVSTTARSGMNDSQTELGLATAVPLDQRQSASRQDPRFSGSASRTSTPRMPFETRTRGEDDDDDDVSIVSDMNERRQDHRVERDFDDMSSVSSFEDDENQQRANLNDPTRSHHDTSGHGHSR